jgi:hypothetical protein
MNNTQASMDTVIGIRLIGTKLAFSAFQAELNKRWEQGDTRINPSLCVSSSAELLATSLHISTNHLYDILHSVGFWQGLMWVVEGDFGCYREYSVITPLPLLHGLQNAEKAF